MYSTRSWNAYKIHYHRKYPNIPISELVNVSLRHPDLDPEVNEEEDEIGPNESTYIGVEIHQHKRSYLMMLAKYYLSLETEHNLSKASCDTVANSTRQLMSTVLTTCGDKLKTLLGNFHLNETEIEDISMSFKDEMEAEVLHSADQFLCNYACELVYKKLCNVTFPEPVVMGYKHQRVKGHLVRKRLLGYRVPFIKQIERLLNLPEIWHFFQNPRVSNDHILRDVCDGLYVKEHALNANQKKFSENCCLL